MPITDELFHVLSHYSQHSMEYMRQIPAAMLIEYPNIGTDHLAHIIKTKKERTAYGQTIKDGATPDEIALYLSCLYLKKHCYVYLSQGKEWVTHVSHKEENCPIKLVYTGGKQFVWVDRPKPTPSKTVT